MDVALRFVVPAPTFLPPKILKSPYDLYLELAEGRRLLPPIH